MSKKPNMAKALTIDASEDQTNEASLDAIDAIFPETPASPDVTPTGVQSVTDVFGRRLFMLGLNMLSLMVLAYAVSLVLGSGGWSYTDIGLFICVLLSAPWMILGFWNSIVGFILHLTHPKLLQTVTPHDVVDTATDAVVTRTAVALAIRHEDVGATFNRLLAIRESLDATGYGDRFDIHILSDSQNDDVIAEEQATFDGLETRLSGTGNAYYRVRGDNEGYKAGNLREFVLRCGDDYDLMIPLDADSLMSGPAMIRLVQLMQRFPKLGILQSMSVGAPSGSAFGRIFQFGMRHGMRAFTLGSAWWQADCGPYWGHNAAIRMKAFRDHCELSKLPGKAPLGGTILSHDQVEATYMRRAGYEVRVLTSELESFEENPVTLLDFAKREQRWCNGNMQYFPLLAQRGLLPVSRFQLLQAIMMYLGSPAWMIMTALAALKSAQDEASTFHASFALSIFFAMFLVGITPKIVGALYVAVEKGGMARYGGPLRFSTSLLLELIFGMLMAPVIALHLTLVIFALLFGRTFGWNGQVRDSYGLSWSRAAQAFWPQTLFGFFLLGVFAVYAPIVIIWAMPVLAGLLLAIPFAVLTAHPALGAFLRRMNLFAIPEDVRPAKIQSAYYALNNSVTK